MEKTTTIVSLLVTLSLLVYISFGMFRAHKHLTTTQLAELLPEIKKRLTSMTLKKIVPITYIGTAVIGVIMWWAYARFTENGTNTITLLILVFIQYVVTITLYNGVVGFFTTREFKHITEEVSKVTEKEYE